MVVFFFTIGFLTVRLISAKSAKIRVTIASGFSFSTLLKSDTLGYSLASYSINPKASEPFLSAWATSLPSLMAPGTSGNVTVYTPLSFSLLSKIAGYAITSVIITISFKKVTSLLFL